VIEYRNRQTEICEYIEDENYNLDANTQIITFQINLPSCNNALYFHTMFPYSGLKNIFSSASNAPCSEPSVLIITRRAVWLGHIVTIQNFERISFRGEGPGSYQYQSNRTAIWQGAFKRVISWVYYHFTPTSISRTWDGDSFANRGNGQYGRQARLSHSSRIGQDLRGYGGPSEWGAKIQSCSLNIGAKVQQP
jgi:hypothetical protein